MGYMTLMRTDDEAVKPIFDAYDVMRTLLMILMSETNNWRHNRASSDLYPVQLLQDSTLISQRHHPYVWFVVFASRLLPPV